MKFLLTKVFQVRNKFAKPTENPDREMPFLEHLEELRGTLVKIISTLIIATLAAFFFAKPLLNIIKAPLKHAGLGVDEKPPSGLNANDWKECTRLYELATNNLPPNQWPLFFDRATADPTKAKLRPFLDALGYYRASLALPENQRADYLKAALPSPAESPNSLQKIAIGLIELNPKATPERNPITMSALKPTEAFMLTVKLALYAGIIFSLPLLLFFIAEFVFPGLTEKEKGVTKPAIAVAVGLFLIGALFSYYVVTPKALEFFEKYARDLGVASDWRIGEYVSFVCSIVFAFGLSFELPVVVMAFVKIGLLSYDTMKKNRSYAIVIIVTIAAIITPTPDAFTLSLLSAPLIVLYEICIWMAYFMKKKELRREAEEEAQRALRRPPPPPADLSAPALAAVSGTSPASPDYSFEENNALAPDQPATIDDSDYEEGFGPSATEDSLKPTPAPGIVSREEPDAKDDAAGSEPKPS